MAAKITKGDAKERTCGCARRAFKLVEIKTARTSSFEVPMCRRCLAGLAIKAAKHAGVKAW